MAAEAIERAIVALEPFSEAAEPLRLIVEREIMSSSDHACNKRMDKCDAWFWSSEWQKAETQAQQDIESGNVREFESADDLLKALEEERP